MLKWVGLRRCPSELFSKYTWREIVHPYYTEQNFYWLGLLMILFCIFFRSEFTFTHTNNARNAGDGNGASLFLSTTSTHSRTFRHLFAGLQLTWLPRILDFSTCNYQAVTQRDLSTLGNKHFIWKLTVFILSILC